MAEEEAPELVALAEARAAEEPEIDPSLAWIWRAWSRLHDERPHITTGFAVPMGAIIIIPRPQKIPWSKVMAWAQTYALSDQDTDILDYCIQELDKEFLEWWVAQNKSGS